MGLSDFPKGEGAPEEDAPTDGPIRAIPRHELRYVLQHVILPQAVFEDDPLLRREWTDPSSTLLLRFRSRAIVRCELAGLLKLDPDDQDAVMACMAVFEPMALESHRRDGYTVHVVTMPPPEASVECYFVAIVHKDDEAPSQGEVPPSTRYFTLEMANVELPGPSQMLCEWTRRRSI